MAEFNWIDYVILAIFFLSMISGFIKGFVHQLISLITLIVAFIIAIAFTNQLAQAFMASKMMQNFMHHMNSSSHVDMNEPITYLAIGLSFVILFVAAILIGSILSYIIGSAFQVGILGIGNRLLGAIFGLVRGFIINLVLIFLVQLTAFGKEPTWQHSYFVQRYQTSVDWLANIVSPALSNLKSEFGNTLKKINSKIIPSN